MVPRYVGYDVIHHKLGGRGATGKLAIDFGNLVIARISNLDTGDDRQDRQNKNLGTDFEKKDRFWKKRFKKYLKEEYFGDLAIDCGDLEIARISNFYTGDDRQDRRLLPPPNPNNINNY